MKNKEIMGNYTLSHDKLTLGYGQAELGRRLGMTQPGVGYAVQRGEHIVKENNFLIGK